MTLVILAAVVACISWTITQEEIFKEPREFCKKKTFACRYLLHRKFFYLFTCEYCFSHYVAAIAALATGYRLLFADGLGYVVAVFALVAIANVYMTLYRLLRLVIKLVGSQAKITEANAKLAEYQLSPYLKRAGNKPE